MSDFDTRPAERPRPAEWSRSGAPVPRRTHGSCPGRSGITWSKPTTAASARRSHSARLAMPSWVIICPLKCSSTCAAAPHGRSTGGTAACRTWRCGATLSSPSSPYRQARCLSRRPVCCAANRPTCPTCRRGSASVSSSPSSCSQTRSLTLTCQWRDSVGTASEVREHVRFYRCGGGRGGGGGKWGRTWTQFSAKQGMAWRRSEVQCHYSHGSHSLQWPLPTSSG